MQAPLEGPRHRPTVAQVAAEHLLHQHVRRLYANPDHPRQQAHHDMRSVTGDLLEALQAGPLEVPDLIPDEPAALHVVLEFSHVLGGIGSSSGVRKPSRRRPPSSAWD
jgi:hypothetical protein